MRCFSPLELGTPDGEMGANSPSSIRPNVDEFRLIAVIGTNGGFG
jgi:hypothetical protein